jgi:hypothetical protein
MCTYHTICIHTIPCTYILCHIHTYYTYWTPLLIWYIPCYIGTYHTIWGKSDACPGKGTNSTPWHIPYHMCIYHTICVHTIPYVYIPYHMVLHVYILPLWYTMVYTIPCTHIPYYIHTYHTICIHATRMVHTYTYPPI